MSTKKTALLIALGLSLGLIACATTNVEDEPTAKATAAQMDCSYITEGRVQAGVQNHLYEWSEESIGLLFGMRAKRFQVRDGQTVDPSVNPVPNDTSVDEIIAEYNERCHGLVPRKCSPLRHVGYLDTHGFHWDQGWEHKADETGAVLDPGYFATWDYTSRFPALTCFPVQQPPPFKWRKPPIVPPGGGSTSSSSGGSSSGGSSSGGDEPPSIPRNCSLECDAWAGVPGYEECKSWVWVCE